MTLKQRRLVEGVKESIVNNTNESLRDIAIRKGYSKTSRNMYRIVTKRHIFNELRKLGYKEEDLKARFELGSQLSLKNNDLTNYFRGQEDICRLTGSFKDKATSVIIISEEKKSDLLKLSERLKIDEK